MALERPPPNHHRPRQRIICRPKPHRADDRQQKVPNNLAWVPAVAATPDAFVSKDRPRITAPQVVISARFQSEDKRVMIGDLPWAARSIRSLDAQLGSKQ